MNSRALLRCIAAVLYTCLPSVNVSCCQLQLVLLFVGQLLKINRLDAKVHRCTRVNVPHFLFKKIGRAMHLYSSSSSPRAYLSFTQQLFKVNSLCTNSAENDGSGAEIGATHTVQEGPKIVPDPAAENLPVPAPQPSKRHALTFVIKAVKLEHASRFF